MDTESINEDWDTDWDTEPLGTSAVQSAEAHEARVKSSPAKPSADEVAKHDVTHVPYRSWCPICVAASAREDRHPRQAKIDTEEGLQVIQADYDLLLDDLILLIVKDKAIRSRAGLRLRDEGSWRHVDSQAAHEGPG